MSARLSVLVALFLGACGPRIQSAGDSGSPTPTIDPSVGEVPWQSYVGTQYSLRPWGTAARDIGSAQRYGLNAGDLEGSLQNFTTAMVPIVTSTVPAALAMTIQAGGLGSGRDEAMVSTYMNAVARDPATIVNMYAARARLIASIPGASDKVYWQLGNEINTAKFSENLHLWAGDGLTGRMHDASTIPWLVEYFFAPAIAGIEAASREVHGKDDGIRIMLGSIAVASNPSAQAFLNALLDYQVVGTFAPSLAGKHVFELVDTISVHYVMAGPGESWRTTLEGIRSARFGQGRVKRVMSTEEVGIRASEDNRGTATALRALARYLSWWQAHELLPDDSRLFFYGNDKGMPSIDTEFALLSDFTGVAALSSIDEGTIVGGAQNIERLEFRAGTTAKRVFVAFSSDMNATSVRTLTLKDPRWSSLRVTAIRYGADVGKVVLPVTVSSQPDGTFQVDLGDVVIGPQDALLVLLEG